MSYRLGKPTKFWRKPANYLWLPVVLLLLAGRSLLERFPYVSEYVFARRIFFGLSYPVALLSSWISFSLTEAAVVFGIPLALIIIVVSLIRLVRSRERRRLAGRMYRRIAWLLTVALALFMFFHGFNYTRQPLAESMNLPVTARSVTELRAVTGKLIQRCNDLRELVNEDQAGVFCLTKPLPETLDTLALAYDRAAVDYPFLVGARIRPKGVYLSHFWSYTGISGMYMPLWVEANVNIDAPEHDIPATALHEIAHARGFAREDEAEFLSFLTGQYSDNPDVVYSASLNACVHTLNALARVDGQNYAETWHLLSEKVKRDLAFSGDYWRQFAGPVQTASTKVNDAYLQANLQTDGVQSYGRMVDLMLAWSQLNEWPDP